MIDNFDEGRFTRQVDSALKVVKTVLDNTRVPQYAADVPHQYEDKYLLVDSIGNVTIAAQMNCLEVLGLNNKNIDTILKWGSNRSVTLRLKSEERCSFIKEVTREVESPTVVTERTTVFSQQTTKTKVVTKVTEYFWKFEFSYELIAFQGNNPEDKVILQQRSGEHQLMTSVNSTPKPSVTVIAPIDLNIGWLIQHINDKRQANFQINRTNSKCHTPRRNTDVSAALTYLRSFNRWCDEVSSYFLNQLFPVQSGHGLDLGKMNDNGLFIPVLPLFEDSENIKKEATKSESKERLLSLPSISFGDRVLHLEDLSAFLHQQMQTIQEKIRDDLAKMFPTNNSIITLPESIIITVLMHAKKDFPTFLRRCQLR